LSRAKTEQSLEEEEEEDGDDGGDEESLSENRRFHGGTGKGHWKLGCDGSTY
jgi:hypothetical protein